MLWPSPQWKEQVYQTEQLTTPEPFRGADRRTPVMEIEQGKRPRPSKAKGQMWETSTLPLG